MQRGAIYKCNWLLAVSKVIVFAAGVVKYFRSNRMRLYIRLTELGQHLNWMQQPKKQRTITMTKFIPLLIIFTALVGCGGSGGSESNGGGDQRGDIGDRPIDGREAEYTISVIEHIGENSFYKEVNAFEGFPMEFELSGVQTDEYYLGNFEIKRIDGCGGVRRLYDDDDYIWETVNNVPGNCTIKVEYSLTRTDLPHLITVTSNGYGASIKPLSLSVKDGDPAYFFLDVQEGYRSTVSGCDGRRDGNQFIVDNVNDHCSVNVSTEPTSGDALMITTSVTAGVRISPDSAEALPGDLIQLRVSSGFGFETTVTGCNGTLSDGIYEFVATNSCAVNAEAYPVQSVPIIYIETTDNEPVNLEIQTLVDGEYSHTVSNISEVALLDTITSIGAELTRPNQSIIAASSGCQLSDYASNIVQEGRVYLSRGEDLDPMYLGGELDRVQTDCTWTLATEHSEYRKFGLATLDVQLLNNDGYDGYIEKKIAYAGTASQFTVDIEDYSFAEASGADECAVDRNGEVLTSYHGQNYVRGIMDVEYGEMPELCTAGALMHSNDYVDPRESYENQ